MIKIAKTKYAVNELIKARWSPRSFSQTPIPRDTLESLFEAAIWAPSSRNEQPWRFICGIKGEGENYRKILHSLVQWNQKWAQSAPVLAIGLVKSNSDYHNQPNIYAHYDLGQSVSILSVQAISNNLYVHQMGGFDKEMVRKAFALSSEFEPVIVLAIGYIGKAENLPDDMRELEEKPRSRYDLDRILFFNEFRP